VLTLIIHLCIINAAKEGLMAKTQRVMFSFDERSLESLQRIRDQGRFSSMGEAVRESLQISRALQSQASQGFSEIIVRNPETKEERVIVIPTLHPSAK
jgi:Arc/MetJ-type ribon-helix-helix transcriptional regulator